jgi:galactonate dehydratase
LVGSKMKIIKLETLMANAGLRNYLFVRLHTDNGLTGIGEATLEWQEKTVQTLIHEWVEGRIMGCDPFDVESVIGNMIRDQYQGGATVMTAISSVEVALWDLIGKACGQPVYKLIGGRYHKKIPAYANGWYGGARDPHEYAAMAKDAVQRGYQALKFDPFGTTWKEMSPHEIEFTVELVSAIREAVGPSVGLMMEYHGRLSAPMALEMTHKLDRFHPVWSEEPLAPENLDLLAEIKDQLPGRVATGERLYSMADFYRLIKSRAADIVQMDISHCGGISVSKKIAAMAAAQDIQVAPHCSIGPVALAAALHFDVSTPNFMIQENFGDFDVPWRKDLVNGWDPIKNGGFILSDEPGLGVTLNEKVIADHPYVQHAFPSLWDGQWMTNFKQDES